MRLFFFAALSLFFLLGPARATVITADLDQISASNIGSGTLGTVTLTQNGPDEVDVTVSLIAGTNFVNSGGPHTPFAFQLDVDPSTVTVDITTPTGDIFLPDANGGSATPYGTFNFAIDYTGASGGGHGTQGPLDFTVTDPAGLSVFDFVKNASGYYFAADVLGPGGNTGSVAADVAVDPPDPSPVPEPTSLVLLCSALLSFGAVRRKLS